MSLSHLHTLLIGKRAADDYESICKGFVAVMISRGPHSRDITLVLRNGEGRWVAKGGARHRG